VPPVSVYIVEGTPPQTNQQRLYVFNSELLAQEHVRRLAEMGYTNVVWWQM